MSSQINSHNCNSEQRLHIYTYLINDNNVEKDDRDIDNNYLS
jgi:hypothetical protein